MKRFRLYHLSTARLETYEIGHSPPYIAVSHAWSEQIFLTGVESSFGGTAIRKIIAERLPAIEHCWIDNFCIKQDDEADKLEQIPLMGDIYSHAEVVAIALPCEFGFTQSQVDRATAALQEAVEAWREERWAAEEFLEQWMYVLVGTRIWTLQEYILASSVIWIGSDLSPVIIDDTLFQAIPGLCNQLSITECMSSASEFTVLHTHFSGMANSRLHAVDRTRAMELLGNRKATVPVDEVYGIMACCGVEIMPMPGETREQAWERWWETAMRQGHVRWALLPPTPLLSEADVRGPKVRNCAVPEIGHRGAASAASWLDSVAPLDAITVSQGVLTLSGRAVGNCTLMRELGSVHQSKKGFLHRDITLILFARGLWSDALQIVEAFGSGRYNRKKQICLAHILVDNYRKALHHVHRQRETDFKPFIRSSFHHRLWGDFIQLQARSIMDGLNYGIGFLAQIFDPKSGIAFKTVVIVGDYLPTGPLIALDFNAVTSDKRMILLIAEVPAAPFVPGTTGTAVSLHKLGTTIPVRNDYRRQWDTLPIESFSLGGSTKNRDRKGSKVTPSPEVEYLLLEYHVCVQ
ncbi:HET domain protein [Macrophomina phaseolina]|uniref:HET domain protein n=1 Tax=Macrophomina phaseolina TaxID=35725 RepID=A0ABQ8G4H2_9PEZI|nr:HET domain protein [Macrophomina phaseolina]